MNTATYNYIFAGTASQDLAKKLAKKLLLPLGKTELTRFVNSEVRLRIPERVTGKSCIAVASTGAPVHENIMELFLLVDTLKKGGAKKILLVIPYFGYSRQHKRFRKGESVSSDVILRTLRLLGADSIITCDFHNTEHIGTSPLPIRNVSAFPLLAKELRRIIPTDDVVVVSPDEGGIARGTLFASSFFGKKRARFTFVRKERNLHKAHVIKHTAFADESLLKGRVAIVVDDICTSGSTLLSAVALCLKKGATRVYAAITHPDMDTHVVALLRKSPITYTVTTNSLGKQAHLISSRKMKIIDAIDAILPLLR